MSRSEEARAIEDAVTALEKRHFLLHDVRSSKGPRTLASRWAMSYLRGPVTISEMQDLLRDYAPAPPAPAAGARTPEGGDSAASVPTGESRPPVLGVAVEQRFEPNPGTLAPWLCVRSAVTVERRSLALVQTRQELWRLPLAEDGAILWEEAETLAGEPVLADTPPDDAVFPASAPPRLEIELRTADRDFVRWRARSATPVLANTALGCAAEPGESREAFIARCLDLADRADDERQERARRRFEGKIATATRRLEREKDRWVVVDF